jgi:hypothetical protein
MNCREWEERLALYAGGDLASAERAKVERHLDGCASCRVFVGRITEGVTVLREAHADVDVDAPLAAVRTRVLARVAEPRRSWWLVYGAAAATVAVLLVAGILRRPEHTAPVAEVVKPAPLHYGVSSGPGSLNGLQPTTARPSRDHKGAVGRRKRLLHNASTKAAKAVDQPVIVKLVTDDPDVVIYWIGEQR